MQIMAFYIVFVLIGDLGAYFVGRAVENWSPTSSLPVFLGCFFRNCPGFLVVLSCA